MSPDVLDSVQFDAASVLFRSPNGRSYTAVEDVNLRVRDGEFVAIVGPTGCGKSTLLNLVAGIIQCNSGTVRVFDRPVEGIRDDVGYLFQSDALLPWLNARDNVALGLRFRGKDASAREALAEEWLGRVGLAGFGDRFPHQLSGGMRKRVGLAQTLILGPKIVLMDEPFSALDVQTRQLMENELLDLWAAERRTVLFVTHDLEEAICLADRVVVLSAGPGTMPVAEFEIPIERPRDVTEVVHLPVFGEIHARIWETLKDEVMKSYQRAKVG